MGSITHYAAFVFLAALVIAAPGPDTALTIRNTLLGGRRCGVFTSGGVATAQILWAFATSLGVAAVLQAFAPAYFTLRVVGAAYLIYLGAHSLLAAIRRRPTSADQYVPSRPSLKGSAAYRQSLLSNLSNPKMAVFFLSLLPQFVSGGRHSFVPLLALGATFCIMTFAWLTFYAIVVAKLGAFLRRDTVRRLFDGITGAALVGIGIRVATEAR
jgi:threonine/homoserine/homoserine lactone efflux protein